MKTKYIVRAARYENEIIFGTGDVAVCDDKLWAENIVDALEKGWGSLFHFGIITTEEE